MSIHEMKIQTHKLVKDMSSQIIMDPKQQYQHLNKTLRYQKQQQQT